VYDSLPDGGFIRLASILPSPDDEAVTIEMESHKLLNAPDYEALNYTWGDGRDIIKEI
jgi:hypothetical protein